MAIDRRWTAALAAAAAVAVGALPGAAAQARVLAPAHHQDHAVLWVSGATTVGGDGTDCAHPGYNKIQDAINAAPTGATIKVCSGTYVEQLQITQAITITGVGAVTVQLPAHPANSTTACDTAPSTHPQPDQDAVAVCGDGTVTLKGLTIDAAWPASTCYDSMYGILVGGEATLRFIASAVTAAGAQPINGCQGGIGIQVGMDWTTPVEVGHLIMADSKISGYQKNGITAKGAGSTAVISHSTVTGAGPTPAIAQNGIEVASGASGTVSDSLITDNECDVVAVCGPDSQTQTQSTGVLFYGADDGSSVSDSVITGNDIGVYYLGDPTKPGATRPEVFISGDRLLRDRYEAVALDQGSASVTDCTMWSGNVGIQVLQFGDPSPQNFGSFSVAGHDVIRDMSKATVQVSSDRAATGDLPGRFVIFDSDIHSGPVLDNSTNLPIIQHHDY